MVCKAYDIRGIYGNDLTEELIYKIGRAFVQFLKARSVVVGYDMRESTPKLLDSLIKGITDEGANVIDIGLVSTPISYFANTFFGADGSIMLTASHNPKEYNGLKLCRQNAIPLSGKTGIMDIKEIVEKNEFQPSTNKGGTVKKDAKSEYFQVMMSHLNTQEKLNFVCDYSNAMGVVELEPLKEYADIIPMYEELDGNFPNHEANPLKHELYSNLSEKVRENDVSFGVMIDGDADRAGFVDENGEIISNDLMTALIAKDILSRKGPIKILYDLRSSKIIKEVVESLGGQATKCRVGHAFIKQQMRQEKAVFAGELSGHFYFEENTIAESTLLAIIHVMNILLSTGKKLSELIHELKVYAKSEEINLEIEDKDRVLEKLEVFYYKGKSEHLDGLTLEFDDGWWFNVRASNTEPILRVNIEADTKEILEKKKYELLETIEKIVEHKI